MRQALWSFWELPRLPRPVLRGKYPHAYPWSPSACESVTTSGARGNLVYEHLLPRNVILADLLDRADSLTVEQLVTTLQERLAAAIISAEEDRMLTAVGLAFSMPSSAATDDPWIRYRLAKIQVDRFGPLVP